MTAPVIFMIFNRPEETRRALAAIRAARPEKLLIIADGPRVNHPDDAALCTKTRSILNEIDWPSDVLTNFAEENMGCGRRVASGLTWAFSIVSEAIILEDDCVADESFFPFCTELLARNRDSSEIAMISGNNFQAGIPRTRDSYYFSRLPHCWGWATWARVWDLYDFEMKWWPKARGTRWLKNAARYPLIEALWERDFERVATGNLDTWDYQWSHTVFSNNMLSIVPAQNLVTNIGFGPTATHTRNTDERYDLPKGSVALPLRHPQTIEADEEADNFERLYLYQLTRVDTQPNMPPPEPSNNPIVNYHRALKMVGIDNYADMIVSGERRFFDKYLSTLTDALVLDVGSNEGDYARAIIEACPTAKVVAFEPHPTTFRNLVEQLSDPRIAAFNIGLGAENGTANIYDYVDEDASAHASLHRAVIEEIHGRRSTSHPVNIRRLDELAQELGINRINLMKIDTEGHELAVLQGAEGLIRAGAVDAIQFEFNEMNVVSRTFFKDFWDFLPEYDFYRLLPDSVLRISHYKPMFCEIFAFQNIVCIRKNLGLSL